MESISVNCEDIPSCQNSTGICKGNTKTGLKTSWVESMRKCLEKWYICDNQQEHLWMLTDAKCTSSPQGLCSERSTARHRKSVPRWRSDATQGNPQDAEDLIGVIPWTSCHSTSDPRLFGHVHFGAFEYERKLISDTVILLTTVLPFHKVFCCIL